MTTILILNIAFAVLVVGGIVSLLVWGIATDPGRTPLRVRLGTARSQAPASRRRAPALESL